MSSRGSERANHVILVQTIYYLQYFIHFQRRETKTWISRGQFSITLANNDQSSLYNPSVHNITGFATRALSVQYFH